MLIYTYAYIQNDIKKCSVFPYILIKYLNNLKVIIYLSIYVLMMSSVSNFYFILIILLP